MGNICNQHQSSNIVSVETKPDQDSKMQNLQHGEPVGKEKYQEIPENKSNQKKIDTISNNQTSDLLEKTEEIQNRKCLKCNKNITSIFVLTNCKKGCYYHQLCMEEHMKKLIESEKLVIKCVCGTKISSNFLRESSIPGKLELLSQLFQRQLELILKSKKPIRNDQEVQNYVKNNQLANELHDYMLIDQNSLVYEETPQ